MWLDGKVVLITGAGSGIGRALAVRCAAAKGVVVLVGRGRAALEETAALIGGGEATAMIADISAADDRAALTSAVENLYGRVDILVNNAGISNVGRLAAMAPAEIDALIGTNLAAPIHLTREMLPMLQKARSGAQIVNVGSMFGDIAYPLFATYSASKFGLRGFSDAMRRELLGTNITVTYIAPRATRTPAFSRSEWLVKPFAMKVDPPEHVAERIFRAIIRRKRSDYPPGLERLFIFIQKNVPRIIDRAIYRQLLNASPSEKKA